MNLSRSQTRILSVLVLISLSACASVPRRHTGRKGFFQSPVMAAAAKPALTTNELSKIRTLTEKWQWPLDRLTVTSDFGRRSGVNHEGVDLKASNGTPVYAVDAGKVIYSGSRISGYGKMIVLRHSSGLSTVYAHNSKVFVKTGERILQGQRLALSGNTGRSSGPHLHFEVRNGLNAVDPIPLLPEESKFAVRAMKKVRPRSVASR